MLFRTHNQADGQEVVGSKVEGGFLKGEGSWVGVTLKTGDKGQRAL